MAKKPPVSPKVDPVEVPPILESVIVSIPSDPEKGIIGAAVIVSKEDAEIIASNTPQVEDLKPEPTPIKAAPRMIWSDPPGRWVPAE